MPPFTGTTGFVHRLRCHSTCQTPKNPRFSGFHNAKVPLAMARDTIAEPADAAYISTEKCQGSFPPPNGYFWITIYRIHKRIRLFP
jgi:hypothetical protein